MNEGRRPSQGAAPDRNEGPIKSHPKESQVNGFSKRKIVGNRKRTGDSFSTVNNHKGRNEIANAAARLWWVDGSRCTLSFPTGFPPRLIISSVTGLGHLCDMLFVEQLPLLTEDYRKAKCTRDIERGDRCA
jgi:hypothetical protein